MRKGKDPEPGPEAPPPPNTALMLSIFFLSVFFSLLQFFFIFLFVILKNMADYTLFLLQKGDNVFHPILLQEVTVFEMMKIIAETFEVGANYCVLYLPKLKLV
jgi:hypothetical protein